MTTTMVVHAYDYLTFRSGDGTETKMAVDQLEMSISGSNLLVRNHEKEIEFPLQTLQSMYFDIPSSSIYGVVVPAEGPVHAYDIAGRFIGTFQSADEAIGHVDSGCYLLKSNGRTTKCIKP